jgi:hypothetical protein
MDSPLGSMANSCERLQRRQKVRQTSSILAPTYTSTQTPTAQASNRAQTSRTLESHSCVLYESCPGSLDQNLITVLLFHHKVPHSEIDCQDMTPF